MDHQKNITLRRARTQLLLETDNTHNDSDMSIDDTVDGSTSLPELSRDTNINHIEEIQNLTQKIELLQTELNSAHDEIERLSLENRDLKSNNCELAKKNAMYKNLGTSSYKTKSPLSASSRKAPSTNRKQKHTQTDTIEQQNLEKVELIDKKIQTCTTNITTNTKYTQTINLPELEQKVELIDKEIQTRTTIITTNTKYTQTITLPELEQHNHKPSTDSVNKKRSKICLLSTNKTNKVLSIAEKSLAEFDLCHYLKPYCKTKDLIQDIDKKLINYTMDDFCVIFIGEEDFLKTQNYFDLISYIRETLLLVKHTNIIICLPTYVYKQDMNMYNWRIENFNNLLYLDVSTYEHAYILDSNKELEYDFSMFSSYSGKIRNHGYRNVFLNLRLLIDTIRNALLVDQQCANPLNESDNDGSTFFRD